MTHDEKHLSDLTRPLTKAEIESLPPLNDAQKRALRIAVFAATEAGMVAQMHGTWTMAYGGDTRRVDDIMAEKAIAFLEQGSARS